MRSRGNPGALFCFKANDLSRANENVRLRFKGVAARVVSERRYHSTQVLYASPPAADGHKRMEMTLTVPESPEFKVWVLGWGSSVEVLQPASLWKFVRSEAEKVVCASEVRH